MGILRDITLRFIRRCFPTLFDKLHVSLSDGHVDSADVALSKSDPLSVHGIPWQVLDGKLCGLSLQMPWMNRFGAQFKVTAKSMHIHLVEVPFPHLQEQVFDAFGDEMRRNKFRFLAEAESNEAKFGSSIRQAVTQVLDRVDLQIEDCTVLIEFADGFTVTFCIGKLVAGQPENASTSSSRTLSISVQGIIVTVKNSSNDPAVALNVPDFAVSADISINEDDIALDLKISCIDDVLVHPSLQICLHSLRRRRMEWASAYKYGRPHCPVQADAVTWFRYAYRRISKARGLRQVQLDHEGLQKSLRSFIEYKGLHAKRLKKSKLSTQEVARAAALENLFDLDMILLLRHAAKRDVAAYEVSPFGTAEWLGWILFGQQMSFEREKLTADLRKSLEQSTRQETDAGSDRTGGGSHQRHCEGYEFRCRLDGLSASLSDGTREGKVSVRGVLLKSRLDAETDLFRVEVLLGDLLFSVEEDSFVKKREVSTPVQDGSTSTPVLTGNISRSPDDISLSVGLHELFFQIQPKILEFCSSLLQSWTVPLTSEKSDGKDHETGDVLKDGSVRSGLTDMLTNGTLSLRSIEVLVFDENVAYNGKVAAFSITLRNADVRQASAHSSFTPELEASMFFQGSDIDSLSRQSSPPMDEDLCVASHRQFCFFSADFRVTWTPVPKVSVSDASGSLCVPALARIICEAQKHHSHFENAFPRGTNGIDDMIPNVDLATSPLHERLAKSGLQLVISLLKIKIMRDPQDANATVMLQVKQLEIDLSSPEFMPVSTRVRSVCLQSSETEQSLVIIEPSSETQYALRLMRGTHEQVSRLFFEVLVGDVSGRVSADVLIWIVRLIAETVNVGRSFANTVVDDTVVERSSFEIEQLHETALLSFLVSSVRILWSDGDFEAEISSSDLQIVAEGDKVSGSAETATLTKVDASQDTSTSNKEVIIHETHPIQTVNSAVRFHFESTGINIELKNMTVYVKRSVWDRLVSSIAGVIDKLKELETREKPAGTKVLQSDDTCSPTVIDGSGITVVIPVLNSEHSDIYADFSRVIVILGSEVEKLAFHRTLFTLKQSEKELSPAQTGRNIRLLQTDSFEIKHQHKVAYHSAKAVVHRSDEWELNTPHAVTIALSPTSLSIALAALDQLLSLSDNAGANEASSAQEYTSAGTQTTVEEEGRVLFRGFIKTLRISLNINSRDLATKPIAEIDMKDIRLSNAEVRDKVIADDYDLTVFTWLASCKVFQLLKHQPYTYVPWRVVFGADVRRFPNYLPPRGLYGISVRLDSRKEKGRDTTTYDISIRDVAIIYDADLYLELSQFITTCGVELGAIGFETLRDSRETRISARNHHPNFPAKSISSRVSGKPLNETTPEDQDVSSPFSPFSKVSITASNLSLFHLPHKSRDPMHSANLHIRRSETALLLSNNMQPVNGSSTKLEGISVYLKVSDQDSKFFSTVTDEELSFRKGLDSTVGSRNIFGYIHMPISMSASSALPYMGYSEGELVSTIESIGLALKSSPENEILVSVRKVSLDTSIYTLLHLSDVLSRYGQRTPASAQEELQINFVATPSIRLKVQTVSIRLCMYASPDIHLGTVLPPQGQLRVSASISVNSLIRSGFKHSQGTIKMSIDIADDTTGHRDQLIFPCSTHYEVSTDRELIIEANILELLRISLSPMTPRMVSALNTALQNSCVMHSGDHTSSARMGSNIRLIARIDGISVRCLSDSPRLQVLRLLLRDIRIEVELISERAGRIIDISIQEFLLEDTVSWRLYRNDSIDSTDSSSTRWERIATSLRHMREGNVQPMPVLRWGMRLNDRQVGNEHLHSRNVFAESTLNRNNDLSSSATSHNNKNMDTYPALRCHITWRDHLEDFKAQIDASGVDLNLDLASLPVIHEWFRSLARELPQGVNRRSSDVGFDRRESYQLARNGLWFSEVRIEPLIITGAVRAAPRRLHENFFVRALTYILDVDSVTSLALHLPGISVHARRGRLTALLQRVLSAYAFAVIDYQFVSRILVQSQRISQLARLFFISLFRRRPYNPLRLSPERNAKMDSTPRSVGLLAALDSAQEENLHIIESSRTARPHLVHRVGQTHGILRRGADHQSSLVEVLDLT